MSTNYYVTPNRPSVCKPIHIGKSSYGWLFLFHAHNEPYEEPPVVWNTYKQVFDWLYENTVVKNDFVIINEYDELVSFDEFVKMVSDKQEDEFNSGNPDNFYDGVRNVDGYRFTDRDFC